MAPEENHLRFVYAYGYTVMPTLTHICVPVCVHRPAVPLLRFQSSHWTFSLPLLFLCSSKTFSVQVKNVLFGDFAFCATNWYV